MLKISKLADYATVVMSTLSLQAAPHCSAALLAEESHIALPTVSKVLKRLNEAGLVKSVRGANGGYQLARLPVDISVVEIIAAIDGEPALTECSHAAGDCAVDQFCGLRANWQRINQMVLNVLQEVSLADMGQTGEAPLVFHPSSLLSDHKTRRQT